MLWLEGRKGKKQSCQQDPWGRRERQVSEDRLDGELSPSTVKEEVGEGGARGGPSAKCGLGSWCLLHLSSSLPRSPGLPAHRCEHAGGHCTPLGAVKLKCALSPRPWLYGACRPSPFSLAPGRLPSIPRVPPWELPIHRKELW